MPRRGGGGDGGRDREAGEPRRRRGAVRVGARGAAHAQQQQPDEPEHGHRPGMPAPLDPHRRGEGRIVGGSRPRGPLRVPGRSRAAHAAQRRFGRIRRRRFLAELAETGWFCFPLGHWCVIYRPVTSQPSAACRRYARSDRSQPAVGGNQRERAGQAGRVAGRGRKRAQQAHVHGRRGRRRSAPPRSAGPFLRHDHRRPGAADRQDHRRQRHGAASLSDVKHIVVLMQENRCFDHYFGTLSGVARLLRPERASRPSAVVFDQYGYAARRRGRPPAATPSRSTCTTTRRPRTATTPTTSTTAGAASTTAGTAGR